jgi:hypothetical protein
MHQPDSGKNDRNPPEAPGALRLTFIALHDDEPLVMNDFVTGVLFITQKEKICSGPPDSCDLSFKTIL